MRALRFALVSRVDLRGACAWAEEHARTASVKINTAAKGCVLTVKRDGDRNINEDSCARLLLVVAYSVLNAVEAWLARRTCPPAVISLLEHPARYLGAIATEGEGYRGKEQGLGWWFRQGSAGILHGDCADCMRGRGVSAVGIAAGCDC